MRRSASCIHQGALPAIHPVNFVVDGDDVVITTSEDSALLSAVAESIVAFEADEIDAANHEAWSVVVTGRARLVTDRQNVERLRVIMRTSTGQPNLLALFGSDRRSCPVGASAQRRHAELFGFGL